MSIFDPLPEERDREILRQRGQHAARLLEDAVLRQAHEDAERTLLDRWRRAQETAEREYLHAAMGAMDEIRGVLRRYAADGELAAEALRRANR